jgi:hypothetical protein
MVMMLLGVKPRVFLQCSKRSRMSPSWMSARAMGGEVRHGHPVWLEVDSAAVEFIGSAV